MAVTLHQPVPLAEIAKFGYDPKNLVPDFTSSSQGYYWSTTFPQGSVSNLYELFYKKESRLLAPLVTNARYGFYYGSFNTTAANYLRFAPGKTSMLLKYRRPNSDASGIGFGDSIGGDSLVPTLLELGYKFEAEDIFTLAAQSNAITEPRVVDANNNVVVTDEPVTVRLFWGDPLPYVSADTKTIVNGNYGRTIYAYYPELWALVEGPENLILQTSIPTGNLNGVYVPWVNVNRAIHIIAPDGPLPPINKPMPGTEQPLTEFPDPSEGEYATTADVANLLGYDQVPAQKLSQWRAWLKGTLQIIKKGRPGKDKPLDLTALDRDDLVWVQSNVVARMVDTAGGKAKHETTVKVDDATVTESDTYASWIIPGKLYLTEDEWEMLDPTPVKPKFIQLEMGWE